ncbi:MAG: hypothetical protein JST21_18965 [Bacteroidetes bacterium]|nr:hypothetical protein [Bacteroidota bacterium]
MKRIFDRYHLQIFSFLTMATIIICVWKNHSNMQHRISPTPVKDTIHKKSQETINNPISLQVKELEGVLLNTCQPCMQNENSLFNLNNAITFHHTDYAMI